LVGLLAAISVFAIVITVALSGVVGRSAADRDLALQVAQARNDNNGGGGSGQIKGAVTLLTSGSPVPGVTVELFDSSDVANAITTTATGADGAYTLAGLAAGDYKVRFRGAGFTELWFPDALDDSGAKEVHVQAGQTVSGVSVVLGGLPASISGTVIGTDVSGAKVELRIPSDGAGGSGSGAQAAADQGGGSSVSASGSPGAIVRTVPVGSDGLFAITTVPSPGVYDLVASKPGYATATQRIDLGGGEDRKGIEIQLRQGDGLISGHVTGPDGPIGGATVVATYGQNQVSTVSLTQDDVGAFTLRDLPTPQDFSIVVSRPGLASTSLTVNLSANQKLTGVDVALSAASGSLGGLVTTLADGKPAPGVDVQVTNGSLTVKTVTQSTGSIGSWTIDGLPIPSDYTVTFSRPDLAPQTVSVSLDANGVASVGSADAISVSMKSSTAVLKGTASQSSGAANQTSAPIGGVSITLASADHTYTVATATTPSGAVGNYEIDGIAPGTYTLSFSRKGTAPTSTIINLAAGEVRTYNPHLVAAALIGGVVTDEDGNPARGAEVRLYVATDYPDKSSQTVALDAAGHYEFDNVDAPQQYVIEVAAIGTGQPLQSRSVALEASQQLTVDFTIGAAPAQGPTEGPTSGEPTSPVTEAPTTSPPAESSTAPTTEPSETPETGDSFSGGA
jgi:5-hydroxyisourate hydrolase-like protein (transthyretin family)